ncbi:hypothetical protein [Marinobacter sp. AL4B]|uniref:hypothetical protein n=1 Tax=Marinobacter sp. AL4B TaxID=2871173 RepID=UPI001CAA4897|nr:hypothetical protein [Marinobacter sp. AL4B]MBZ0335306.1 hypothetical protein [Marinobacter sp. AL4B]
MSSILENLSYVLPVVITGVMTVFLWFRRKTEVEFREISRSISYLDDEKNKKNDNIEKLVMRGDVELRVLEEITDASPRHYFFGRGKSTREIKLERVKNDLREILRDSIESENFTEIKERILKLLDEIADNLHEIRQRVPFDGLEDPERSLLIDLIEEIEPSKEIPRQKAQQLADIIKLKHQDIKKLQLENSKAAGWTRWGTVGTVSFGLLSLALSIYTIST